MFKMCGIKILKLCKNKILELWVDKILIPCANKILKLCHGTHQTIPGILGFGISNLCLAIHASGGSVP